MASVMVGGSILGSNDLSAIGARQFSCPGGMQMLQPNVVSFSGGIPSGWSLQNDGMFTNVGGGLLNDAFANDADLIHSGFIKDDPISVDTMQGIDVRARVRFEAAAFTVATHFFGVLPAIVNLSVSNGPALFGPFLVNGGGNWVMFNRYFDLANPGSLFIWINDPGIFSVLAVPPVAEPISVGIQLKNNRITHFWREQPVASWLLGGAEVTNTTAKDGFIGFAYPYPFAVLTSEFTLLAMEYGAAGSIY